VQRPRVRAAPEQVHPTEGGELMAVYVTLKCDGMMPPGSTERCRAAFSVQVGPWLVDETGELVVDVDRVTDDAAQIGWSQDYDTDLGRHIQFCPSCTRHRTEETPA
jgi:hypothetical protein